VCRLCDQSDYSEARADAFHSTFVPGRPHSVHHLDWAVQPFLVMGRSAQVMLDQFSPGSTIGDYGRKRPSDGGDDEDVILWPDLEEVQIPHAHSNW
jgi:hypothetical protein